MIAAWMLYSIVVGLLLGAGAVAAERVCRALRQPGRFVWGAALTGTVLLSAVGLVRSIRVDASASLPVKAMEGTVTPGAGAEVSQSWLGLVGAGLASGEERVYGTIARVTGDGRALAVAWVFTSLALLTLFAAALLRFRRARRGWRAQEIAGVGVYVAARAGPALVGLRRPEIVVPAWLLRASESDQRLVVQHEQEHRIARDHLFLAGACLSVCLLPWNIALWGMLRRTRLAVELDCDARVLRRGVGPADYGTLLLNVAARAPGLPLAVPALADTSTHLEQRILAMTRSHDGHAHRRAAIAALCTAVLGLAACSADMPTAAEIDQMDVAAAEAHVRMSGQLVQVNDTLIYVVDDVVTPAYEARAIAPERIASIEITKGTAAKEFDARVSGVVHVRTKDPSASSSDAEGPAKVRVRGNAVVAPAGHLEIRPADVEGLGRNPLIVIDGEIAPADLKLSGIDPETIERIEVIKGPAARQAYGERGANGVIRITRKK